MSTTRSTPSLHPDPGFEYYYKACKKGDSEAQAVTVDPSPVARSGERRAKARTLGIRPDDWKNEFMSDQEPRFPSTEDIIDRVAAINKVTGNSVALENIEVLVNPETGHFVTISNEHKTIP